MKDRMKIAASKLVVCVALVSNGLHGQIGESGLSFLKLGVSGRGAGMADAMSGHVNGAAATYYNPAGMVSWKDAQSSTQLMLMHREWIQGTRAEFIGASISIGEHDAIGFSVTSTTVSDIEIRTRPGDAEGTFTARNYALGASYARIVSEDLSLGVTAKFLYEKILIDEASGVAFDLGAMYKTPVQDLSIGASLANLGSLNELRNEKTKLPALLRIGPAYKVAIGDGRSSLILASDFLQIFPDSRSFLNVGGEFDFERAVAGRIGYQFGSEGRRITAGVGICYGMFALDYAYAPLSYDLGNSHAFSLAINF